MVYMYFCFCLVNCWFCSSNCCHPCPGPEKDQEAWVTNCKHIICHRCIDKADNGKLHCDRCDRELDFDRDFVSKISFKIDEQELKQAMVGVPPKILIKLCKESIDQWVMWVCFLFICFFFFDRYCPC